MWDKIFWFLNFLNIFFTIYPFLMHFEIKINILRLKGVVNAKIFFFKINFKFRIKNGYIYLYFNKKEIKEKLTNKNINIRFILELVKQTYFRQQIEKLSVTSNFGYVLNSCTTAVTCGYIQVLSKCLLSKIKNNKKSAHIFIEVNPKYNEDIFNFKVQTRVRMSGFDMIYAFVYTIISLIKYKLNKKLKKVN